MHTHTHTHTHIHTHKSNLVIMTLVCVTPHFCYQILPYLPECKTPLIWHDPPGKTHLPRENVFIQISDDSSEMKSFYKEVFYYLVHLIYKMCQILSTFTNVAVSIFTVGAFIFPTSPSSSLSFHNVSSSVPSTPIDVQHFMKSFTVTSGEMRFHAIMIHTD